MKNFQPLYVSAIIWSLFWMSSNRHYMCGELLRTDFVSGMACVKVRGRQSHNEQVRWPMRARSEMQTRYTSSHSINTSPHNDECLRSPSTGQCIDVARNGFLKLAPMQSIVNSYQSVMMVSDTITFPSTQYRIIATSYASGRRLELQGLQRKGIRETMYTIDGMTVYPDWLSRLSYADVTWLSSSDARYLVASFMPLGFTGHMTNFSVVTFIDTRLCEAHTVLLCFASEEVYYWNPRQNLIVTPTYLWLEHGEKQYQMLRTFSTKTRRFTPFYAKEHGRARLVNCVVLDDEEDR